VQEELLGHLLGALDDDEQESVASRLSQEPELREQLTMLENRLRRLDSHRAEFDPPPRLAERTCALIAAQEKPSPARRRRAMSPEVAPPAWISRVRWLDVAMALGVFFAAAMLTIPAIQNSRFRSQITTCQDNLRLLGESLTQYSERYAGYFPVVPTEGNAASPSIYAPTLAECDLLDDATRVFCPAAPTIHSDEQIEIPTLEQLRLATGDELLELRRSMGGDYGYSYGHIEDGEYRGTRNFRRPHFAVISDVPSALPERQSLNHGGRGQNVWFEDGHVMFVARPRIDDVHDDFFHNDRGLVGPGLHADDSVIAPSDATPIVPVELR